MEKTAFFQVWDASGNFSLPWPRIHLISSRPPSTFTGLARHESGWRGLLLDRRPVGVWAVFDQRIEKYSTWKRKFRRVQQQERTILENTHFFSVFPIAAVRAYLQPVSFWIVCKDNFGTSRFHCHRSQARVIFLLLFSFSVVRIIFRSSWFFVY